MNKKDIIIEAARKLFGEYGYKKVSMDEVAREANITKKTIYTYFKDKEDLFSYFIKEELEIMKKDFDNEDDNTSFIEKVSRSIYHMFTFRKNSKLFSNISKEKESLQNSNFLKLYNDVILDYIERKINKAIELKYIKNCDSNLVSFIIYKVYLAVMFEYNKELDEEKITREITSILKNGLFN